MQEQILNLGEINPKSDLPEIIEYVDLESVKGATLISHEKLESVTAPSRAQRLAQKGDVFFQTVRPYQKNNYFFDMDNSNFVFSSGYAQIRPTKVNGKFLFYKIQSDNFVIEVLKRATGTSYPAINSNDLSNINFLVPKNNVEQKLIGNLLIKLDEIIALEQEKLNLILKMKHVFLRKVYSTKVNDNMVLCKLNNYISKKGKINKENKEYIVSSVNNKKGFINQSEQFESTRLNNLDKSTYRIIDPKDFAYNPSRINVGSIGYNDTDNTLIVSPLYIAFRLNDEINDRYFYYYTQTEKFLYEVNRNTEGSVRQSLTFGNMGNINIPIPNNYQTQLLISQYFKKIDNIIFITEQKINRYEKIKTYLLQSLFV